MTQMFKLFNLFKVERSLNGLMNSITYPRIVAFCFMALTADVAHYYGNMEGAAADIAGNPQRAKTVRILGVSHARRAKRWTNRKRLTNRAVPAANLHINERNPAGRGRGRRAIRFKNRDLGSFCRPSAHRAVEGLEVQR